MSEPPAGEARGDDAGGEGEIGESRGDRTDEGGEEGGGCREGDW